MRQATVKKLIAITESYTPKISAFALYNACAQLIEVSPRYEHLRRNTQSNAAKLAAELLAESDKFFTIKKEMEEEEQKEEEEKNV
jgi:hypothetical protein